MASIRVLEDACKSDSELRAVLGDSIGNPELMRKRVCGVDSFSFCGLINNCFINVINKNLLALCI